MSVTAEKSSGTTAVRVLTIDSLANPTAPDANAADAFDVMIPSIPGYGYSGKHRRPAGAEAALPSDRRQAR